MKKYIISSIFIFLALLWMAVIFYFSNQNAVSSTTIAKSVTRFTIKIFVPQYGKLSTEEQRVIFWRFYYFVRKMAHFMEFAILSFFLFSCLKLFLKKDWLNYLVTLFFDFFTGSRG